MAPAAGLEPATVRLAVLAPHGVAGAVFAMGVRGNGVARGPVGVRVTYVNRDPRAKDVPTDWRAPLGEWRLAMKAAGASDETLRVRTYWVAALARDVVGGPWEIAGEDLIAWGGGHDWAPETRRSAYAAVRKFYAWAHGAGRIGADPAQELPRVRETAPHPHPCPDDALDVALRTADADVALMIILASRLGLRRGEVARVHARDVVEDLDGLSLVVHGKGGKERTLPLDVCLAHDIRERAGDGYLFPGRAGHITPGTVGRKVADALPDGWTMHSLRHRFGTLAYRRSQDLMAVQQALGHASPATTQRYVAVGWDRLRAAMATV